MTAVLAFLVGVCCGYSAHVVLARMAELQCQIEREHPASAPLEPGASD